MTTVLETRGLVKRFGGIARDQRRLARRSSAARATR